LNSTSSALVRSSVVTAIPVQIKRSRSQQKSNHIARFENSRQKRTISPPLYQRENPARPLLNPSLPGRRNQPARSAAATASSGALGFKLAVRRHLFTNHVQPVVGTHIAKKHELLSEISHKVLETIV
jgi:hypothetical protein